MGFRNTGLGQGFTRCVGICSLLFSALTSETNGQQLSPAKPAGSIRVATYNVSMNRRDAGGLAKDLAAAIEGSQPAAVAAVIRTVKPDILLLNEVDFESNAKNARQFEKKFLRYESEDLLGSGAWGFDFVFDAPVNTGVPSGLDLNKNQSTTDPEDAFGYGVFPGQYGMAVLSRFPLQEQDVVTMQKLLWASVPGALRPQVPAGASYYDDSTWQQLRLSSKSFWDVPLDTPLGVVHLLTSHPTPPAFDGPEDRNGCRNHDEIRLVTDYIDNADYIVDDNGKQAGLSSEAAFVVLGDLNSDPKDGGSRPEAIERLLNHPRVVSTPVPASDGAVEASEKQGRANKSQRGNPAFDTGDFSDRSVGNLRIDYVLPSKQFKIIQCGVFWPKLSEVEPQHREAVKKTLAASDHHLVWIDIAKAE